ncbi:MAG: hypothetical protein Q9217_001777 [Psora testacea]
MTPSTAELVKSKLLNLSTFLVNNQASLPPATYQRIYATLPTKHQSALRQLVFAKKRKSEKKAGRTSRLQRLFHIESVEPSQEVRDRIETWVKDFSSFFQDPVITTGTNHSLSASFQRISQSAETREVATIRRRFDLESIYKRVVRSGYYTDTGWRHGGSARLAEQLQRSSLISDGVDEIRVKLEKYAELGRSWNLWAERLGGPGFLIVLPQTVAEGSYERRQNLIFLNDSVDQLCELGIQDTARRLKVLPLGSFIAQELEEISPEEMFSIPNGQHRKGKFDQATRADTGVPPTSPRRSNDPPGPRQSAARVPRDATGSQNPNTIVENPESAQDLASFSNPHGAPDPPLQNTMAFNDFPLLGPSLGPDLTRPQWGSTNAMASSTAGAAFPGYTPSTGVEWPELNIPEWGSSQTMAFSAVEDNSCDFDLRTWLEGSDSNLRTQCTILGTDSSTDVNLHTQPVHQG